MARPILGPACAGHARAMPARRTMQTLASAGSVSDRLQPTQTVAGAAALKSSRKIRSLTRKESQSSAEPIAPPPASDTKKVAQQDDKQSKEAAQKHAAVAETLKRITKEMGPNMIMAMDSKQHAEDMVVEIFGPESCGKTSLAVCIMAEAQKQFPNDNVVLMDLESSFDISYGMRLGLQKKNCYVGAPNSGDQALKMSEQLIASGGVSVVVIDSVSALMPESELDRDFGDPQVGSQARLLSTGLRRLSRIAGQYNVTLIFINQLRMKIGVIYGNPETTSGGMALRFYASQRIDVRRKEMLTGPSALKEAPNLGIRIRAKIVKNKTAPPGGEALFDLYYDRGIDKVSSTVDGAVLAEVVEKRASYYYYHEADGTEMLLGQGKHNAVKTLENDPELRDKIHTEALKRLHEANRGRVTAPDEPSDDESVAGKA